MKPNREELEWAIKALMKLQFSIVDLSGEELLAIGRGVTSIRAALDREKNPLTCDGCDRPAYWCTGCKRRKDLPDHYQPKGEKA